MEEKPSGTANILRQNALYEDLCEEYSPVVANELTSKSLERKGIKVPPEGCEHWHTINKAAVDQKLDLEQERFLAESQAKEVADGMLRVAATGEPIEQDEIDADLYGEDENEVFHEDAEDDERPSLGDLYGYENDEDNEEAALDDVLKLQEQN